jgi:hypothetical protein
LGGWTLFFFFDDAFAFALLLDFFESTGPGRFETVLLQ